MDCHVKVFALQTFKCILSKTNCPSAGTKGSAVEDKGPDMWAVVSSLTGAAAEQGSCAAFLGRSSVSLLALSGSFFSVTPSAAGVSAKSEDVAAVVIPLK